MSTKRASDSEELGVEGKKLKRTIEDASDEFLCPITLKLPFNPVIAEDGRIYEREAIEQWFKSQLTRDGIKSPVTNVAMGPSLIKATQVKNLIEMLVNSGAVQADRASDWRELLSEKETFKRWRERAEGDDSEAMVLVGEAYRTGSNGVRACHLTAAQWFMRAGRLGNNQAYEALRQSQFEYCPRQYMHLQSVVTCEMREILIDWLVEVHFLLGFKPETLHLAVGLVDRFGATESMVREKLQLVGVASLLVACKSKCEPNPPDAHYLAHLTAKAYSPLEVDAMVEFLVRKFGSSISVPTSYDFLADRLSEGDEAVVKLRAWYYLEQSILNHEMLSYNPTLISSAALLLANCSKHMSTFKKETPSLEAEEEVRLTRRRSPRARKSVVSSVSTSSATASATRDVEIYENSNHMEMLQQLLDNKSTDSVTSAVRKRKGENSHDMFSLVEYGWMQSSGVGVGVPAFGHASVSVIECAIVMCKEVCRPPRRTPQGRVLDSVLKKYTDAAMQGIAKEELHPCILAAARRTSNQASFDDSTSSTLSTSTQTSASGLSTAVATLPVNRLSRYNQRAMDSTEVAVRS